LSGCIVHSSPAAGFTCFVPLLSKTPWTLVLDFKLPSIHVSQSHYICPRSSTALIIPSRTSRPNLPPSAIHPGFRVINRFRKKQFAGPSALLAGYMSLRCHSASLAHPFCASCKDQGIFSALEQYMSLPFGAHAADPSSTGRSQVPLTRSLFNDTARGCPLFSSKETSKASSRVLCLSFR